SPLLSSFPICRLYPFSYSLLSSLLFFHSLGPHRHPHSFPTRRSSDLYRVGVAQQQTAYNQPPHPSFYLASDIDWSRVEVPEIIQDRKSTRLNSSHVSISYAVFCLKKKTATTRIEVYMNNTKPYEHRSQ